MIEGVDYRNLQCCQMLPKGMFDKPKDEENEISRIAATGKMKKKKKFNIISHLPL